MFRRVTLTILLASLALLALVFGALNPQTVDLELAFTRVVLPLGVAIVIALIIGLLAGIAWRVSWVAQLLAERGRLRRALREAETRAGEPAVRSDVGH